MGASALELMESVLGRFAKTEPFHFEVDASAKMPVAGVALEIPIRSVGDFQPSDRSRAILSATLGFTSFEVEFVIIDDVTFFTDPLTGEWDVDPGQQSPFTNPLELVVIFEPALEGLTFVGVETLDGVEVVHVTGPTVWDIPDESAGAAQLDIWIRTADSRIYKVGLEGTIPATVFDDRFAALGGDASATIAATFTFSDYGKPVVIEAPVLTGPGRTSQTETRLRDLGNDHIVPGDEHPSYKSVPAASGWHYSRPLAPAPWGIYDRPLPDEVLVHNLEHGGIGIHYDCPEGCPELVARLAAFAPEYDKVIVSPYPGMGTRIALTAWTFIDKLDEFDEERIAEFIDAHMNSPIAPEPFVP